MRKVVLLRSFFAVLLGTCLLIFTSQKFDSGNASATPHPSKLISGEESARRTTSPTDLEWVPSMMTTATFATAELSKWVKARRDKGAQMYNELQATKSKIEEERKAAMVNVAASGVAASAAFGMGAAAYDPGSAAAGASTTVAAITELEKLRTLEDTAKTELQALLPLFQEIQDAEKVSPILARISQDKDYAAKFITAAHNNLTNPGTLGQLLQTDSSGSTVEVREVKESNGLTVVFRVGKLTHCLSTNQQCNAQPYSVTR